jgi:hypothetical protein
MVLPITLIKYAQQDAEPQNKNYTMVNGHKTGYMEFKKYV